MRIVIDAMGSDNAPGPEVEGAIIASRDDYIDEIILVGDQERLRCALGSGLGSDKISIEHAAEVITTDDAPAVGIRKKKDSSLLVAMRMLKQGKADGVISAGNTGAVHVAARMVLGPIRGVARSAICQVMPTTEPPLVILDLGANVDCTARHLSEFAEMGMLYSKISIGVDNPRVGLLNIGEEQAKGNEVAKAVHRNLVASPHINFIGNIEPKALFSGAADVVVCDGFVGNVILKTCEAATPHILSLLRKELLSSLRAKVGAWMCMPAFARMKSSVDPNSHPGAPLLGVNGVTIICHGSCDGNGIASAICGMRRPIESNLIESIHDSIEEIRSMEDSPE